MYPIILYSTILFFQAELDKVVELWNSHRIRPSKNRNVPSGRPVVMYTCGERLYGVENRLHRTPLHTIHVCLEQCTVKGSVPCDETVFALCCLLMEEHDRQKPDCGEEAVLLYQFLRNAINVELS